MKPEIDIDLSTGLRLVAWRNTDPDYDREIYIGLMDQDDCWVQDLVIARNEYTYDPEFKWKDNKFELLIYGDAENENHTSGYYIPVRQEVLSNLHPKLNPVPDGDLDAVLRGE